MGSLLGRWFSCRKDDRADHTIDQDSDEGEFEEEGGGVSGSVSEDDDSTKYQNNKAKFEKHRGSLVGKTHVVSYN